MAAALLPAGKVIQVDITGTQRDQRVFSDPEVFRPERHLEGPAPGIWCHPLRHRPSGVSGQTAGGR
jgi:cytochrome P450